MRGLCNDFRLISDHFPICEKKLRKMSGEGWSGGYVCVCACVCVLTLWQDWIVWYTAVHVGVDRTRRSRQVLLPDSFLNTNTPSSTLNTHTNTHSQCTHPNTHTYSINTTHALTESVQVWQTLPTIAQTYTHTTLVSQQAAATHSPLVTYIRPPTATGDELLLRNSPISLWPDDGFIPVYYFSSLFPLQMPCGWMSPKAAAAQQYEFSRLNHFSFIMETVEINSFNSFYSNWL